MNNPAGREHIKVKRKGDGGEGSYGYRRCKLEDKVEGGGYSISYKPSNLSHQERKIEKGRLGEEVLWGYFFYKVNLVK